MTKIYVQFSDDKEATIVAAFSSPQDEAHFPNQGGVDSSDARWVAFYKSIPEQSRRGWPAPSSN
ncbi:hypothetical protein ACVCH0_20580 [Burkholderia glumae]|uniref:hypothetical protein n=1 Tax=Burkholderia glumae TaxID=337 RepID=UPI00203676B7|nr:hypothetical protein [Burkholderia glumae]MCM2544249.1 hypothetical protein [Burkholderia glumae]